MKNIIYLFLLFFIVACDNKASEKTSLGETPASEYLLNVFPVVIGVSDTLHFYNLDSVEKPLADSIVREGLSGVLIDEIGFQTGGTKYEPIMKFPLDEDNIACVLNVNESWYKQQSLLIFNKSQKAFEKIINLSQFYGGDGGQMVTESWLYKEKNEIYLYQIESSHAMIVEETSGEPEEFLSENTSLYKWTGNFFESSEMKDSIVLTQQFQLSWEW